LDWVPEWVSGILPEGPGVKERQSTLAEGGIRYLLEKNLS
jgi:hypothetical protein